MSAPTDRRVRRVLYTDHPDGDDLRDAANWVSDIRSRLAQIRGELEDVARIEARFPHDRTCQIAAGTITLILIALHRLIDRDQRSFQHRAERLDELWADVIANPDAYVIEETERDPSRRWDWRPSGIFKRGGQ